MSEENNFIKATRKTVDETVARYMKNLCDIIPPSPTPEEDAWEEVGELEKELKEARSVIIGYAKMGAVKARNYCEDNGIDINSEEDKESRF